MKYLLIFTFLFSGFAYADCEKKSNCDYSEEWSGFTWFTAEYSAKRDGESTEIEFTQNNRELLVDVVSKNGTMTLFSVHGVATLYHGVDETGFKTMQECRQIVGDSYAILQGYAARAIYFIGVGSGAGPEKIKGLKKIDYAHEKGKSRIQINPGDHIKIGIPWYLKGTLENNNGISYDIHHKYTKTNELVDMFISGKWSDKPVDNRIENTANLADWLVCINGESSYVDGEYNFVPSISDTINLKNVGHLRALTKRSKTMPKNGTL
jgi:hypothetical protein